jgi:hypothetical protein
MIGVVARATDVELISEFFELFKTPWELYESGRAYDVLLSTTDLEYDEIDTKLVLIYSSRELASDCIRGISIDRSIGSVVCRGPDKLPIYCGCSTFRGESGAGDLIENASGEPAVWRSSSQKQSIVRIGYDLFNEIRHLLTLGQPAEHADIPTLELHIDILRQFIVSAGVQLIEVPPVPAGYPFIACLTHDVDHPSLKLHRWDHTTLGLLYRATVGSLLRFLRGRMPMGDVLTNWRAAAKVLLFQIGIGRDFWLDFPEKYGQIEGNLPATYFLIPYGNYAGTSPDGQVERLRAAAYGISDIAEVAKRIALSGKEVALHGLDAWVDAIQGQAELEEVRCITQDCEIGTRSHWLYFAKSSPPILEQAGAAYDSTVGYRETVGYKAGTAQAYRPLGAKNLLELPLHVMDTALFLPVYLQLSATEASERIRNLAEVTAKMGGCLTVNWHDRSLFPDRLWHRTYRDALAILRKQGAWFATAREAVAWFRARRMVKFERILGSSEIRICTAPSSCAELPGLMLRLYNLKDPSRFFGDQAFEISTYGSAFEVCKI